MGAASTFETHSSRTTGVSASTESGNWQMREQVPAAPLLLSALALVLVLLATPYGLGVSPDSTQYLSAAEHLLRGDGLRVHWWDEGAQPFTHFPPGFAVSLSFLTGLGLTADASARLINSVALFISAFLAYALTRKASGSITAGLFGAAAVVLAR